MFSHDQVWCAIDALAQINDMSVSRLARNAGLDSTTFNKSKRTASDGRLRWPSTESLSKIMAATSTDIDLFLSLMAQNTACHIDKQSFIQALELASPVHSKNSGSCSVPLIGLAQAGSGGFFDDAGLPSGEGWDAVEFPGQQNENTYALEISGDSMLPLYRDGDRIIVSTQSSIRRGDRVVVRTHDGEVMAKILCRETIKIVELKPLNPVHETRTIQLSDIDWIARIIWASQ